MKYPQIISPWVRLVEYPGNHLNDFCIFRGPDSRWHAIGIIGTGTWASETSFFHCSSAELYGPYTIHEPLLRNLRQGGTLNAASQKHAPFVVAKDGFYHMFFRRPPGTNLLVTSRDCFNWSDTPEVVFECNDARDACIQEFDGIWHWYYCQWLEVAGNGRSCILLRRSEDLRRWSEPAVVHYDTSRETRHSHLESPFVVRVKGRYWLFVRNRALDEACVTTVFSSDVPDRFACGEREWDAELAGIHAPELVFEGGRWHIIRASGPPDMLVCAPRRGGWLEASEIAFSENG